MLARRKRDVLKVEEGDQNKSALAGLPASSGLGVDPRRRGVILNICKVFISPWREEAFSGESGGSDGGLQPLEHR